MAIIDRQQPSNYSPVHDDLWHMVESDNATAVDFKYVFDFYIGSRQLVRTKVFPDPQTGKGYFNASNVISNEMKFDWFVPNGNVVMHPLNDSGEYALNYVVRYGEDVSGVTTLNLASGSVNVLNSCAPLFRRRFANRFEPNTSNKFITNGPKVARTNYGETLCVGMMGTADNYTLYINTYNEANTLLTTGEISVSYTDLGVYQLDIGMDAIEYGLDAALPATMSYYDVVLFNLDTDTADDTFRVYKECVTKYEPINLHFMNNMGVFDTARFACVSRLSMDVQRKTFEKPDYRFGNYVTWYEEQVTPASTIQKKYYETKVNYGSQYQWTYKLTMNFPTDEEYQWLSELLQSPIIYMEVTNVNREFYPVSIKATNYEYSKHVNNGLRAFEVEIDLNIKRNGFRR